MAARVTKLFLQNCLQARTPAPTSGKKAAATKSKASASGTPAKSSSRRRKSKAHASTSSTRGSSGVRFLEAAQSEQKQADKTKENLRKLKTRANDKSQRLMAKALEKRKAMRL